MLQNCEQFFEEFFDLFDEKHDLRRHLHRDRIYNIGLPKTKTELEDLEDIKQCIAKVVQHPEYSENIRPVWALFEHILQKEKKHKKIVSRNLLLSYNNQLTEFRITDDEISKMLIFLNRAGFLLYFEEDDLKETIILDFQWFVDAFKHIISYPVSVDQPTDDKRQHFRYTGELDDQELDAIWETLPNKGKDYFDHKPEILSYMERLGLLAVCNSESSRKSTWYYIPSMNKRKFDMTGEGFSKSSILCFKFSKDGQLPLFVFYGVVLKCFKIQDWSILTERDEDQKCIYETAACFSFHSHIVALCVCEFQIQVQVWRPAVGSIDLTLLTKIQKSVEDIIRTYEKYNYKIGYKCQNGVFNDENEKSFVEQEIFPVTEFFCKTCPIAEKHYVDSNVCWVCFESFLLIKILI